MRDVMRFVDPAAPETADTIRKRIERESTDYLLAELKHRRTVPMPRHQNFFFSYYQEKDIRLDFSSGPGAFGWEPPPVKLPDPQPRVVVLIVTLNCWPHTQLTIERLLTYRTYPYRILVVDNGSTDGTPDRVQEWMDRLNPDPAVHGENVLSYLALDRNYGLPTAMNAALNHIAPDEDVMLMNNDILPHANWCENMVTAAYEEEDVGIVGCKLVGLSGRLQHLGSVLRRDFVGETNLFCVEVPDTGMYSGRWYPDIVMFSAAYIPAKARAKVPVFDAGYFAYFEDSDYCLQLLEAGLKVVYDGRVSMVHAHQTTTRENGLNLPAIFAESKKRFYSKWGSKVEEHLNDGPIVLRGLYHGTGGYPRHCRELARSFDLNGVPTWLNEPLLRMGDQWRYEPIEENEMELTRHLAWMQTDDPSIADVIVNFSLADRWMRIPDRVNIGMTMLETDGIPEEWVKRCNAMEAVWVPSTWVAEMFRRCGVKVPVQVLKGPLNTDVFHPAVRPIKTQGDYFRVLSVFDWGERKAPEVLLEALGRLAQEWDDLEVVLKTNSHVFDYATVVAEYARKYGLRVQVLPKGFQEWMMPSLYRACDVFVLPSRGEGCGYPFLEAMACGIPVVGTDCTAQRDYLSEETGYPVRWSMIPAQSKTYLYDGFNWADPDLDHLVERVREARRDIESGAARARTVAARKHVEDNHSYAAVARQAKENIRKLLPMLGRPVPVWARGECAVISAKEQGT